MSLRQTFYPWPAANAEMRLLVTGANGFIGSALMRRCAGETSWQVRGTVRKHLPAPPINADMMVVGDLTPDTDWSRAVAGVDAVVHAAARVHVMRDRAADPLADFRRANVDGTMKLARQAAAAGVNRFVFISSIKVNGDRTMPGRPFRPDDIPAPVDPYGVSKAEAEEELCALANKSGMKVVIIRPVLVYGPGVKANFHSLMRLLRLGLPLPLGAIRNARSMVALDNLVDLIVTCVLHPDARNQTFLVSDGDDLSTTSLLQRLGAALGSPARLIPVPSWIIGATLTVLGRRDVAERLCGSLQVDMAATHAILGWVPPVGVDDALKQTARHFLATVNGGDE